MILEPETILNLSPHALTAGISTVISSLATGAYLTWRRWTKDKNNATVEVAKVSAEVDVLHHLTSQRDYAMNEARESKRNQILAEFESQNSKVKTSALEIELANLRSRVTLLSQLVTRLTTALDLTRSQLNGIIKKTTESATSR
jgi:hypothetical protein